MIMLKYLVLLCAHIIFGRSNVQAVLCREVMLNLTVKILLVNGGYKECRGEIAS